MWPTNWHLKTLHHKVFRGAAELPTARLQDLARYTDPQGLGDYPMHAQILAPVTESAKSPDVVPTVADTRVHRRQPSGAGAESRRTAVRVPLMSPVSRAMVSEPSR